MGSITHAKVIIMALFMAAMIISSVHAEELSVLTYNDTTSGFSFDYPEGAVLSYAADSDTRELAVMTPQNITMITIVVSDTSQQLENLTQDLLSTPLFLPEGKVIGSGAGTLGGSDSFFLDYSWVRDDVPVRTYTVTTVKDGKLFTISYDNRAEQFEGEKPLIDQMIDSFTFIEREADEKYYPGYYYYPGTVYDVFGMPVSDGGQYDWDPYSYGWDGSTGYQLPSQYTTQFPSYTGYDPYGYSYQQYPQPTMMPTQIMTMGYTMAPTIPPTMMPTMQPYSTPLMVPVQDINKLVDDGLDFLSKKQYKQAEQNFMAALQIDSSDYSALYGYAKVLYHGYEGREEEALEQVKLSISYGTGSASDVQLAIIYTLKALIERYLGHYPDALTSIEFVIAHDRPEYLDSDYYIKAKILYEGGLSLNDAIAAAKKAVELAPDDTDYSSFLSELESKTGQSGGSSVYPQVTPAPTCTAE